MFTSILCPVDPAELGFERKALTVARQLAGSGAKVTLLTVIPDMPALVDRYLPADFREKQVSEARTALEDMGRALGLPEGRVHIRVRHGNAYHEILEEAQEAGADLIVMASHRPGFATYLMGSTASYVARHATCSVLIIRGDGQAEPAA